MKRKILLNFIFVLVFIIQITSIKALPTSISGILQSGNDIEMNGYDYLALKYYGADSTSSTESPATALFCTQFKKKDSSRNIS